MTPTIESFSIASVEKWVGHPLGTIYTRSWMPEECSDTNHPQTPIVLFHDSLGCVDLWRNFPADLSAATHRTVIAYDRLGFGRSDRRSVQLGLDFIIDEAVNFFPHIKKRLDIKEFIAFGHSVGGSMAVNCAAHFADECLALITESAQVFPENRTLQAITAAKEQFQDAKQIDRLRKYHADKSEWVLNAWTGTWLDPAFVSWTLAGILPQVECPLLAIHGALDEYGSTCQPEMLAGLSGGPSQVKILENTFHVPHREHPELIVNLVADFIANVK